MSFMAPFQPSGDTVNVTVGASSGNVRFSTTNAHKQVWVMNNGSATVWIKFGGSAVAATLAAGLPVGPGRDAVFTTTEQYAAAIAAGATGLVYFTPGSGM